jgi:hypothetical protein
VDKLAVLRPFAFDSGNMVLDKVSPTHHTRGWTTVIKLSIIVIIIIIIIIIVSRLLHALPFQACPARL